MGVIRILLAISVVIAHSTPLFGLSFVGGRYAVQCFYMVSGFYMALVLNEKYLGPGSYRVFISARLLRLFPVYLAVVLATLAGEGLLPNVFRHPLNVPVHAPEGVKQTMGNDNTVQLWEKYAHLMTPWQKAYFAATNLTTLGQESTILFAVDTKNGEWVKDWRGPEDVEAYRFLLVPQAWSIGVELMFYFVAPFLVRRKIPIVLGVMMASMAVRLVLFKYGYKDDPWNYRFFPSELFFFMVGTLAYRTYKYLEPRNAVPGWLSMAWWIATVVVIVFWMQIPLPGGVKALGLLGLVATAIPIVFMRTKRNKLDRYIGELSYPVYISHFLVVSCLTGLGWREGYVAVPVTIVVSIALYHLIDRPVDSFRHKWATRASARAKAAAAASGS
ncbi:MAG: acyltransferase [Phycisphaerales bacterium]|nr:acyltransferase [Planctomycetota bacterium]